MLELSSQIQGKVGGIFPPRNPLTNTTPANTHTSPPKEQKSPPLLTGRCRAGTPSILGWWTSGQENHPFTANSLNLLFLTFCPPEQQGSKNRRSSWKRKNPARPEHKKVQVIVVGCHRSVSYAHTCEHAQLRVWSVVGLPRGLEGQRQGKIW